ncbi:lycopene cyclase domain-containing protein [Pleomorphovibrio marinus]|uniref:lycopene cyclase domain-containing protein n=1 Tax=Pleomorphovibrio marinus TaxID=2164132 RepID=UPI000E0C3781|nr:lycopene cyclase domain-containing protein [Pleomorphovibrio marinus]
MPKPYYYLGLMLFTVSYPLAQSFEHRIQYHKQWYALFPAILAMALVFIVWDHLFTEMGIWGFNPRYILGIYFLSLPIEEWAFFLIVPFACIFIYEVLNYFVKKDILKSISLPLLFLLIGMCLIVGVAHLDKWYTGVSFIFTAVVLAIHLLLFRNKYFGRFFLSYLVTLIPFMLVNGILTGSWIDESIVWYNNEENLSIRIGTVPIEDSVYNLGMLLMVQTIYEKIRESKTIH